MFCLSLGERTVSRYFNQHEQRTKTVMFFIFCFQHEKNPLNISHNLWYYDQTMKCYDIDMKSAFTPPDSFFLKLCMSFSINISNWWNKWKNRNCKNILNVHCQHCAICGTLTICCLVQVCVICGTLTICCLVQICGTLTICCLGQVNWQLFHPSIHISYHFLAHTHTHTHTVTMHHPCWPTRVTTLHTCTSHHTHRMHSHTHTGCTPTPTHRMHTHTQPHTLLRCTTFAGQRELPLYTHTQDAQPHTHTHRMHSHTHRMHSHTHTHRMHSHTHTQDAQLEGPF